MWHGASIAFIVWGMLNALFQTFSDGKRRLLKVLHEKYSWIDKEKDSFSTRLLRRMITFGIICITWIFFRAGDLSNALEVIRYALDIDWAVLFDGSLYEFGINRNYFHILLLSIIALFAVDSFKYQQKDVVEMLEKQEWWFQVGIILVLYFSVLLFGCYGKEYDAAQFIYFQF